MRLKYCTAVSGGNLVENEVEHNLANGIIFLVKSYLCGLTQTKYIDIYFYMYELMEVFYNYTLAYGSILVLL